MRTIEEPERSLPVTREADVIVCGGGPSGIAAAVSAARNGARTLLIEKNGFLGGNATMWLPLFCFLDVKGNQVIRGIPQEIVNRMAARGGASGHYRCQYFASYTIADPEAMKLVAQQILTDAGVEVMLHTLTAGAIVRDIDGGRIDAVITESKSGRQAVQGGIYIDCTGDADVAAAAGAPFCKGDDSGSMQPPTLMFTMRGVDTEKARRALAGENSGYEPIAGLPKEQIAANRHFIGIGMADITAAARKRGEWTVPRQRVAFISTMHDDEVGVNMTRIPRVDATDADQLTQAEMAARAQIDETAALLRNYVPGFERSFLGASAATIGVRETRRIAGEYELTEEDVLEGRRFADEVLLGGYIVDIHFADREGCVNKRPKGAYGIPYRSLLPKAIDNLLVAGRCLSASPGAMAATRVMVTCMAAGEAAGCAAAMSHAQNGTPRLLDTDRLRSRLREQGVCLEI